MENTGKVVFAKVTSIQIATVTNDEFAYMHEIQERLRNADENVHPPVSYNPGPFELMLLQTSGNA